MGKTTDDNSEVLQQLVNNVKQILDGITEIASYVVEQPWVQGLIDFHSLPVKYQIAYYQISFLKHFYIHDNRDPIYAWKALSISRRYQLPMPEWAVMEVASAANKIINLNTDKFQTSIKRALDINIHSINKVKSLRKFYLWYKQVNKYRENKGLSKTYALEEVSYDLDVPLTTLRVKYNQIEEILSKPELPSPFSADLG